MEHIINSKDTENDEPWQKLIDMLFAEETDQLDEDYVDIEEFIYAGVWLSLNLFALDKKLHESLMVRLNDPKQFPVVRILEAIEHLSEDDDRESEIMLLLQLIPYAQNSHKQIEDILFNPELVSSYRYSRMLLIDDVLIDDEDVDEDVDEDIDQNESCGNERGKELDDEDLDIPF